MQEAFIAALLAIARDGGDGGGGDEAEEGWVVANVDDGDDDNGLDGLVLWIEIQKQVAILREGMKETR